MSIEKQADLSIDYVVLEKALVEGNLEGLTSKQRLDYINLVCQSVGLNPATQPFQYIKFNNGAMKLYACKGATEQLRKVHNISISSLEVRELKDILITTVKITNGKREDIATGAVSIKGLSGNDLANAYMKCETKAKRRGTLSFCGLGMLDETEIETIPNSEPIPLKDEKIVNDLYDRIDNAVSFDELKIAYKDSVRYARQIKDNELEVEFTKSKDMQKSFIDSANSDVDKLEEISHVSTDA